MPQLASNDFGARFNEQLGKTAVHDHFFPGANTALPYWRGDDKTVDRAAELLKGVTRIDIFGIREGGAIEGDLTAPLDQDLPTLAAGEDVLIETVVRTLKLGHHLTQGTVDSNELWVEVTVKCGDKTIGKIGGMDELGQVDPWSHFINVFMLDRHGNRIERRNAQDIFTPLYNHQIPPGAGQTIHYALSVPEWADQPIKIEAALKYRKFDATYLDFMNASRKPDDLPFRNQGTAGATPNELPVVVMCSDRVVLPVKRTDGQVVGVAADANSARKVPPAWERWNDYGIGMLLAGKSQLLQAAEAFAEVEKLDRSDGPLNLARVLLAEGDYDGATAALRRAATMTPPPPPWTTAWLSGQINREQGYFEDAAENFRSVLEDDTQERRKRKFDFSRDYRVRNLLGQTLLDLASKAEARGDEPLEKEYLDQAEVAFKTVLKDDSEDATAHANLALIYQRRGDEGAAAHHRGLHLKYKTDDNAGDIARPIARRRYPAADHAAEQLVIYSLQRPGAPELPSEAAERPKESVEAEPKLSQVTQPDGDRGVDQANEK